jgi:hypothetical protein
MIGSLRKFIHVIEFIKILMFARRFVWLDTERVDY